MHHHRNGIPNDRRLMGVRVSFISRASVRWGGRDEDVLLLDIGLRGVYVEHASAPAPGTPAIVRFALPGNELPIEASCRVVWRHAEADTAARRLLPPGCGLEFKDLEGSAAWRIRQHLDCHLAKTGRARRFVRDWPDPDDYLADVWEAGKPAS